MDTPHSDSKAADAVRPSPGPPRWLRVGVADLLLLVLVVGILQRSQGSMLDDPGLGWHIRHVDAMWAAGGWLTEDPFSGPRAGQPWRTNQWLGDVALYLGWQWGGLEGIAAVTTIVLALTFWLLYHMLLVDRVPWPLALVWTMLATLGTSMSWVARPNVATLLLIMVTAWTLDRFHRGQCSRRNTLWLWPLFAVWANVHGGFVAGLVLLALTALVEGVLSVVQAGADARVCARRRAIHVSLLGAGALLATLLNPYGWGLYPWIFQLLGDPFFMNLHIEWLSPNFHDVGAFRYELLMLALPLLVAFSRRGAISVVALAMSVLWLHFAFNGQRYVALWVLISVPLMARLSTDILNRLARQRGWTSTVWRPASVRSGVLGVAVIVAGLIAWSRWTDGYSRHEPRHIPTAALGYVLDHHNGRAVFHDYGWGGWLIWHGWPAIRTWIDDRNEVQGQAHIEQHFRIMRAEPGWHDALTAHGVALVCIPVRSALANSLAAAPQWTERYRDGEAVIYENTRPTAASGQPSGLDLGHNP